MGVVKQILREGTGPRPSRGQSVTVHCTGYGKNGDISQKFWSTKDPGQQPFTFKIGLGSVIKGWDEGVMGMQVGEVAHLQRMASAVCRGIEINRFDSSSIILTTDALLITPMDLVDSLPGGYSRIHL